MDIFSGQKLYIYICNDNSSNGYGKCETVRDDRVESPCSPCSAIFTNSCLAEFEEEARKKSARTERDSREILFFLFSRRYFYRKSERVNGFSEYGSSVFAVTWCIKKRTT